MTDELGRFREGFLSFRRMMAAVPPSARLPVFLNAASEAAVYVSRGLDRTVAADELHSIALEGGLDDTDAVQFIISRAFEQIIERDRVPDPPPEHYPGGNGHDPHPPPPLLPLINIKAWQGLEPKPRQWIVQERIPARNVTLLTGQGGVGKTLLMQQLAVATVLSRDWIGTVPEPGPVLFITAEDDEDEMHFRFHLIAKHPNYDTNFTDLADAGLHLLSLAGKDAAMAIADARGIVRPTELFATMVRTARQIRPRWIGLDTAADIFVVNERDRSQVRQCISLLRGVALELDTAVILLAHPSLAGITSGSGLSGSTAWNNSVRSRLYLKTEKKKDGDKDDDEAEATDGQGRVLEFLKSNYSALAAPVKLTWRNGLLVPDTIPKLSQHDAVALEQRVRQLFLDLLKRYTEQNRTVSYKERSNNFAPAEFATKDEAKALVPGSSHRKQLLRKAMDQLLDKGTIAHGRGPLNLPPSKRYPCLVLSGQGELL